MSAGSNTRKVGAASDPLAGPAKSLFLFCVTKEHVLNCSRQFNGGLIASPIDGTNDSRFVFQINEEIQKV